MRHTTLPISESLQVELEAAARESGFAGPLDLIEALLRDHRKRRDELVAALAEGEASGREHRSIADIVADGRKRAGL